MIGCDGALRRYRGRHLSGGACNQSAAGLEKGAPGRLLPTDGLVPRPMDVGVRRGAGRALIAHRTPVSSFSFMTSSPSYAVGKAPPRSVSSSIRRFETQSHAPKSFVIGS